MTDNENKQPEELGEDPEILAENARATKELKDYLESLDVDIDYWEADWKDTQELIEGSHSLVLKHPGWPMKYVGGDEFGIDSNYVLFSSKPLDDEAIHHIFDLIVEYGAELPEPYVPKCPKCGKAIEALSGSYPASVPAIAHVVNGELSVDILDGIRVGDCITDEDVDTWYCPECDEVLFDTKDPDYLDKMEVFLKGGD